MDPNYSIAQPVELGGTPAQRLQLHTVYSLYRSHFHRWFAITAPTSLIASVILFVADQRIREIYRSIPRGEIAYHPGAIAGTIVLRYGSFFYSVVSCQCFDRRPPGYPLSPFHSDVRFS